MTMEFAKTCERCRGRGYEMPPLQPVGSEPPRTVWCIDCNSKGRILTHAAVSILTLIASFDEFYGTGYVGEHGFQVGPHPKPFTSDAEAI